MLKVENAKCIILQVAEPKAWEFNGKKGVAYRAKIAIEGQVYSVKLTEEQSKALQGVKDTVATVSLTIKIFGEKAQVSLESYVVGE